MKNIGKVAIIGSGGHGSIAATALALVEKTMAEVVVVNDAFERPSIPYLKNPAYNDIVGVGDSFICKGKHQYREVEGQWICQCGRNMND